jgi:hypothetical protein
MCRLCDIGSGSGCVGLAAACLGADVTLTDLTCVFPLLKRNMEKNISKCGISHDRIRMAEYDWGHDTSHLHPPFDVVIVSDCILPKLYPIEPLVQVIFHFICCIVPGVYLPLHCVSWCYDNHSFILSLTGSCRCDGSVLCGPLLLRTPRLSALRPKTGIFMGQIWDFYCFVMLGLYIII